MIKNTHKNPIVAVLWQDAAYSFENKLPDSPPLPKLSVGFVIETNEKFLNLATNVQYDKKTKELVPVDGFLIPQGTILDFKKIGDYEK